VALGATLRCPFLVEALGASMAGGTLCLAFELCDGGSLAAVLAEDDNRQGEAILFSGARRLELARDAARGLAAMHSVGWAHLDVKDHNVMLATSPVGGSLTLVAKIADFGSARRIGAKEEEEEEEEEDGTEALVATAGWAAPELLQRIEGVESDELPLLSSATDCFSFGVLLWRCLAPRLDSSLSSSPMPQNPLAGLDAVRALEALRSGVRPPWPSDHEAAAAVVHDVGAMLEQCWSWDPEQRPRMDNAAEVIERGLLPRWGGLC
jgi:serine/threonine protein kinase